MLLKKSQGKVFHLISIQEVARYTGIGLNSVYNAVHDKELIPDIVLKFKHQKHFRDVRKYLFLKQTVLNWKRQRENRIPTKKAGRILGLTHKQMITRVHSGKLVPDVIKEISKGRRGSYYTFFFFPETLRAFQQSNPTASQNENGDEQQGALLIDNCSPSL